VVTLLIHPTIAIKKICKIKMNLIIRQFGVCKSGVLFPEQIVFVEFSSHIQELQNRVCGEMSKQGSNESSNP
jgi:hypothetical protein